MVELFNFFQILISLLFESFKRFVDLFCDNLETFHPIFCLTQFFKYLTINLYVVISNEVNFGPRNKLDLKFSFGNGSDISYSIHDRYNHLKETKLVPEQKYPSIT